MDSFWKKFYGLLPVLFLIAGCKEYAIFGIHGIVLESNGRPSPNLVVEFCPVVEFASDSPFQSVEEVVFSDTLDIDNGYHFRKTSQENQFCTKIKTDQDGEFEIFVAYLFNPTETEIVSGDVYLTRIELIQESDTIVATVEDPQWAVELIEETSFNSRSIRHQGNQWFYLKDKTFTKKPIVK